MKQVLAAIDKAEISILVVRSAIEQGLSAQAIHGGLLDVAHALRAVERAARKLENDAV